MLRSVVFFYIKSPLRVEEAGLQELIPTTWWPNRFTKEVSKRRLKGIWWPAVPIICWPRVSNCVNVGGLGMLLGAVMHLYIVSVSFCSSFDKTLFLVQCSLLNQGLSPNQGKESKDVKEESAEERLRRRAYERGCQRLKKRIEGL